MFGPPGSKDNKTLPQSIHFFTDLYDSTLYAFKMGYYIENYNWKSFYHFDSGIFLDVWFLTYLLLSLKKL